MVFLYFQKAFQKNSKMKALELACYGTRRKLLKHKSKTNDISAHWGCPSSYGIYAINITGKGRDDKFEDYEWIICHGNLFMYCSYNSVI